MPSHDLTERQRDILRGIFVPYADKIEHVGLFGSRATGKARADSDIDLAVYGSVSEADIDRMRTLFDASGLAIKVDIVGYDFVTYPAFKQHIDAVMKILFTRQDLKTGNT